MTTTPTPTPAAIAAARAELDRRVAAVAAECRADPTIPGPVTEYPAIDDWAALGHVHGLVAWVDADGYPRSIVID